MILHSRKFLPVLIGALCILVTSWPIFQSGFFRPHDYTHAARIVEMNRALQAGEFPVRWSENFGFGYGMPLFNFYAPLPYYVAQMPFTLTHDAILSIKFLYLLICILSFAGMFFFAREYWESEAAGTVSAVLFSFATYKALDLYVRGAIGEVSAMVLLPFALYGVLSLKKNQCVGIVLTSLSVSAILLSHNLSGMISIAIVFAFGLSLVRTKQFILSLIASIGLAIALSSFYVLPAFFEKGFTRIEETITTGYFDYHNHFVALRQFLFGKWGYGGSVPGLEDGISFALGWIPILLVICILVGFLLFHKKIPNFKLQISKLFILLFFLGGTLFMATNKSVFIWDHVATLKFMQFPWRFLGFAHIFLAAIAGSVGIFVQREKRLSRLLVVVIFILTIVLNSQYFQPEKYINDTDTYYSAEPKFISSELSKTLNDYLPKVIEDDHFPAPSTQRLHAASATSLHVLNDAPARIDAQTSCTLDCDISVNIFQFPGWKAWIDGKEVSLQQTEGFPTYFVSVPSGVHTLSVQLTDTPIRKIGNTLSILSVGLLLFYVVYRNKRRS